MNGRLRDLLRIQSDPHWFGGRRRGPRSASQIILTLGSPGFSCVRWLTRSVSVIYHPARCSPGKRIPERTVMPESSPNVLKTYVDDPAAVPLAKLDANAISGAQDVSSGWRHRRLRRR